MWGYERTKSKGRRAAGRFRRAAALVLSVCMVVPMLSGLAGLTAVSAAAEPTTRALNRIADNDTTDTYVGKLLSQQWGSRYAGRVWTDKSVFAADKDGVGSISLNMNTDGYNGNVGFDSDFGTVFSALASSQVTNEAIPIDLMLGLDITASMLSSTTNMPDSNLDTTARTTWKGTLNSKNSNMALSLAAANELIRQIRAISSDSRISIVVFHGSGYQMIPFVDGDVEFTGYSLRYDVAGKSSSQNQLTGEHPQAIIHYTITNSETDRVPEGDYVYDSISGAHYRYPLGKAPTNDTWSGQDNAQHQVEPTKAYASFDEAHFKLGLNVNAGGVDVVSTDLGLGMLSTDDSAPTQLGGGTGLEGGIYTAMSSVAAMKNDNTYTMSDGAKVTRIPVIVIQGDGATNHVLIKDDDPDADRSPGDDSHRQNPWYNGGPYNGNIDTTSGKNTGIDAALKANGSSGNWWDIENPIKTAATYEDSSFEADFNAVLQAAYWKAAVANAYNKGLNDVLVYTVGLGAKTSVLNPGVGFAGSGSLDGYTDRRELYNAFNAWKTGVGVDDYGKDSAKGVIKTSNGHSQKQDKSTLHFYIDSADNTFHIDALASQWGYDKVGNDPYGLERPEMTYNYNCLPDEDPNGVEMHDLELNYTKQYFFVESNSASTTESVRQQLNEAFQTIATDVYQTAIFVPLSGDNDAGVTSSITYEDPLGEYMEIKHNAITIDGVVTESATSTFDMSILLFGRMLGLVRAGVYDYQWNDKYMAAHSEEGIHGQTPFPMGWYKGEDASTAYKADPDKMSNGTGSWPSEDPKTGTKYTTAAEAWADGWVMRFDFQTLLDFVPIANAPENGLPQNLDESVKNTIFTCYRFDIPQAERNKLYRNPIYGQGVPESLENDWNQYFLANGSYPVGTDWYSAYPGVFRLSDIRVWAEHTGDYIDESGAITPEEQSGYDDSLYVNVPVAAVPTQLAEITLGADGPLSYKDNLADKTQSTPIRLFYAVGLTEDLIQRDSEGKQTGVDVSKISGEYIASHSDPTTSNIYFISNWYSNTAYRGYTSDEEEPYRTRGDAAVTFSPATENRYYLFQKPLPLIAHAYRVQNEAGDVAPVDKSASENWGANGSGNGATTWEKGESASNWSGGEFIGTYDSQEAFKTALSAAETVDGVRYIKDAKGYTYPVPANITDAVITYTRDQLDNVDEGSGKSFSSDDYFFLCVEYYLPLKGEGVDIYGKPAEGTHAVRKVYRMIARKGSAFGSGLHSENIDNGDMLCWSDINGKCNLEIKYNSRTDTGDNTRGRPTLEKLTKSGTELKTYLKECGLKDQYLDEVCTYWENVQNDSHMQALISQIKAAANQEEKFKELFDWSVSAKTGGIRLGDMFNNLQAKGGGGELDENGYYKGNVTQTANNYYIPTLSEQSTAGNGLIINNYLGNNGRLEVANATLMVTKTLVAPEGFTLTQSQLDEDFQYQVYVQNLTGERLAQRLKWNPFSQSWQKRVETLDILTDNSSLLLDTNGSRALFCVENGQPRQVVAVVNDDGSTTYCYADANGSSTGTPCAHADKLYCIYLPGSAENLNYRLFASDYETGTEDIQDVGTTAYYPASMEGKLPAGDNDNQLLKPEITGQRNEMDNRPAGTREYWTKQAVLIPYEDIMKAEADNSVLDTVMAASVNANVHVDIALMALMADNSSHWEYDETKNYQKVNQFTLVTVIPNPEGTDSTVYSPYSSRTQYMTTPLYFGYKAGLAEHLTTCENGGTFAACKHLDDYKLSGGDVYDQVIPTVERPDLFNAASHNANTDDVAKNTAEYTLKSGEGLLLTGLGNRIVYRFTEKLTDDQLAHGYTLKEISHVQQRGSDTVYMPGVQEVPVYLDEDGAVTWAIGKDSTAERTDITPQYEPFAHTNATIWESYATMAAGSLGNHHQPEASTGAAKNPNCNDAKTEANLSVGQCDIVQADHSTRHYFYYGGKLVDPHYEGEMEGMSRYVLNPTAHFGVEGESVTSAPAENPKSGYYDYTGVYSVFGNTGYFSEQAHYTNTVDPELFVLTKSMVDTEGNPVKIPPNQEFTFTVTFTPGKNIAMTDADDTLHYWKGDKDTWTSSETWPDGETTYKMPEKVPMLDAYEDYLKGPEYRLRPIAPDADTERTYTVKLKANEAIVFYGLIAGTDYTVREEPSEDYPVVPDKGGEPTEEDYIKKGTILRASEDPKAMNPVETPNRAEFTNLLQSGILTVEKYIHDDDRWAVEKDFGFTVALTAGEGMSLNPEALTVTKFSKKATGEESSEVLTGTEWTPTVDGGRITGLSATFRLKHGERIAINGIPYGTAYTVTESDQNGYYLEHVADNPDDTPGEDGYLAVGKDGSVGGTIANGSASAYLLFNNARPLDLPFTGSGLMWTLLGLAAASMLGGAVAFLVYRRKRGIA